MIGLGSCRHSPRAVTVRSQMIRRRILILPGKFTHNALIESFNGRLRDELLNEPLLPSISQTRASPETWHMDHNANRMHSQLSWLTPTVYAAILCRLFSTILPDGRNEPPDSSCRWKKPGATSVKAIYTFGYRMSILENVPNSIILNRAVL